MSDRVNVRFYDPKDPYEVFANVDNVEFLGRRPPGDPSTWQRSDQKAAQQEAWAGINANNRTRKTVRNLNSMTKHIERELIDQGYSEASAYSQAKRKAYNIIKNIGRERRNATRAYYKKREKLRNRGVPWEEANTRAREGMPSLDPTFYTNTNAYVSADKLRDQIERSNIEPNMDESYAQLLRNELYGTNLPKKGGKTRKRKGKGRSRVQKPKE